MEGLPTRVARLRSGKSFASIWAIPDAGPAIRCHARSERITTHFLSKRLGFAVFVDLPSAFRCSFDWYLCKVPV